MGVCSWRFWGIPAAAVRMGDYKRIERFEDGTIALYDLKADIGERRGLAAQMPAKVEAMKQPLHGWYKDVGARFLSARPAGLLHDCARIVREARLGPR